MRIGLDLRALQVGHENRGIGVVVKSVLENIHDETNEYYFYIFEGSNPIEEYGIRLDIKGYTIVRTKARPLAVKKPTDMIGSMMTIYHRYRPLKKYKLDAFVQFDFMLGLPRRRKTNKICYMYDLAPLILRQEYIPSPFSTYIQTYPRLRSKVKAFVRRTYYEVRYRRAYKNYQKADKVIAVSDFTKKSARTYLPKVEQDKIEVVALAGNGNSEERVSRDVRAAGRSYVFYIGGTDSRKHVEDVVFAYNIARGRGLDFDLMLVGKEFDPDEEIPNSFVVRAIEASPYKGDIVQKGYVSDEERARIYAGATAFVFTSYLEGFGLPILEAQAEGCPVIAYNNSSIMEVAAGSAILVKTGDYVAVAEAIKKLGDMRERERVIVSGKKNVERYSWEGHVQKLFKMLEAEQG